MRFRRFQQTMNLIAALKYEIALAALLVYAPFTAFEPAPGSRMLGGLFQELGFHETAWAVLFLLTASWSLMFICGLLVEGKAARWREIAGRGGGGLEPVPGDEDRAYFPPFASRVFRVPVTWRHVAWYAAAAAGPGALVMVWFAGPVPEMLVSAAGAGLAALAAFFILLVLCLPVQLADGGYSPVPGNPVSAFLARYLGFLSPVFLGLRRAVSFAVKTVGMTYVLDPKSRLIDLDHFFSLTNVAGLLALLFFFGNVFQPPVPFELDAVNPPSVVYVFILVTLLIWTIGAMQFHFSRIRFSPVAVLLVLMGAGYMIGDVDHFYHVDRTPVKEAGFEPLTPVEAARNSLGGENLVVVATSGGGIRAAGWTAKVLANLTEGRPGLVNEIRFISAVSGGAVGAAYYLHGMRSWKDPDEARMKAYGGGRVGLNGVLSEVFANSVASSLSSVSYGVVFLDFWRLVTGGILPLNRFDRGMMLEDQWEYTANTSAGSEEHGDGEFLTSAHYMDEVGGDRLIDFVSAIREGRLPAPLLSVTNMETGRRIMITPLTFGPGKIPRAPTLDEYLFGGGGDPDRPPEHRADIGLWTAARMSATFAYVTPAARAAIHSNGGGIVKSEPEQMQHLIDGGYYDNYGIASAMDCLEPVFRARLDPSSRLRFNNVMLVEIRSSYPVPPAEIPPQSGYKTALLGPLLGLSSIQDGAAVSRNRIEFARFAETWRDRFGNAGLDIRIENTVFHPPENSFEPLSWHLTSRQIEEIDGWWTRKHSDGSSNAERAEALYRFLR